MTAAQFPDVDVIIVAHGAAEQIERAVDSVTAQVGPGRIAIVDAGGCADPIEAVRTARPDVRAIPAGSRGFAAAANAGIAATTGELVLLLDADAELDDRCLRPLADRLRSNRSAAIVAPRVTDADGTVVEGSFGQFPTLGRASVARLNRLAHRMSKGIAKMAVDVTTTTPVDWVTGACMLVRRSAIATVGPMDEGFRRWCMDVEWCHRMREAGHTVLIEPLATCVWRGPASGSETGDAAATADLVRYCRITHTTSLLVAAQLGERMSQLPLGGE